MRGPGVAGFAPTRGTPPEVAALLADPDAPFRDPRARILKNSPSSTVAILEVTVDGSPRNAIYKRFRVQSLSRAAVAIMRRSKCMRSWLLGNAFVDCLLPTARPLAAFERRRFGQAWEGYLLTEMIDGAIDLRQAFEPLGARRQLHSRIDLVARLIRTLHERGWSHRDLKAPNILLAPSGDGIEQAWFIDLVGASRPLWLTRRRQIRDLARLNASFIDRPGLSRTDRLRFLLCYLNSALSGRGDWKVWWTGIARATEGKMEKNRKRGRPLA
jgi:hypothetical protein